MSSCDTSYGLVEPGARHAACQGLQLAGMAATPLTGFEEPASCAAPRGVGAKFARHACSACFGLDRSAGGNAPAPDPARGMHTPIRRAKGAAELGAGAPAGCRQ